MKRSRISFKRKQKNPTSSFSLAQFLSSPFSSSSSQASATQRGARLPHPLRTQNAAASSSTEAILPYLNGPSSSIGPHAQSDNKDGNALDWYVEGPGRRVGYDDLTAIDWIYEYNRERKRLRDLPYQSYVKQLWDVVEVWVLLVMTGAASGVIAGFIDVASDWLADLKTGFCSNVRDGGKFYLSKSFCCSHYDDIAMCSDWKEWGPALGVSSAGGSWLVEGLLFVIFSVSRSRLCRWKQHANIPGGTFCCMCELPCLGICATREA